MAEIAKCGGIEKTITILEAEQAKSFIAGKIVYWTKDEVRYLRRNYLRTTYRQLAKKLGKSEQAIHHKLSELYSNGLKYKYNLV